MSSFPLTLLDSICAAVNTVVIRPNMAQWFAKEEDRIIVQSMDVGNVEVIARIIAQSVALDHYHR